MPALVVIAVAGCELEQIQIPASKPELVIHGVLTRTDTIQVVLVERTLTGLFAVPNVLRVSGIEPIFSDGGIAERDAVARLTMPDGQVIAARELSSFPDSERRHEEGGTGGGVYVFKLRGTSLIPGGAYRLHITTTQGEIVTAETVFPEAPAETTAPMVVFNRSRDTLALAFPTNPRAPAYQLRVESPYGGWFAFTDSARVSLTGGVRNPANANLPHVFLPGFRQRLTISAVDANLFDYYRTSNNSFTGRGIVSRVTGAYGVFGSMVTVSRRMVETTADQSQPIEGIFDMDPALVYAGAVAAFRLTLYVESPAVRANQADAITGSYGQGTATVGGALGTLTGTRLKLVFPRGLDLKDTVDVLYADLRGDTLVGTFSKGAPARYIKRK